MATLALLGKAQASQRRAQVWAVWTFLGSSYVRNILIQLNPEQDCRQLVISHSAVSILPDDVLQEIYDHLHDRGSELECQPTAIWQDLRCELLKNPAISFALA